MLKTWKKAISLVLVIALSMMMCVPAFAAEKRVGSNSVATESQIQAEIQQAEEKEWSELYRQLEEQNALGLMDAFKEALRPQIEAQVRSQYNTASNAGPYNVNSISYYFPNGGYVAYTGSLDAHVVKTCLNPDDTLHYAWNGTNTLGDVFMNLLGYVPGLQIIGVAGTLQLILSIIEKNDVEAADYYAEILHIESGADSATVMSGWDNHPYCIIPDDSTILGHSAF